MTKETIYENKQFDTESLGEPMSIISTFTRPRLEFGQLTESPRDLEMFFRPDEFRQERHNLWLDRLTKLQLILGTLLIVVVPVVLLIMKAGYSIEMRVLTMDALAIVALTVGPACFERQTRKEKLKLTALLIAFFVAGIISLIILP